MSRVAAQGRKYFVVHAWTFIYYGSRFTRENFDNHRIVWTFPISTSKPTGNSNLIFQNFGVSCLFVYFVFIRILGKHIVLVIKNTKGGTLCWEIWEICFLYRSRRGNNFWVWRCKPPWGHQPLTCVSVPHMKKPHVVHSTKTMKRNRGLELGSSRVSFLGEWQDEKDCNWYY